MIIDDVSFVFHTSLIIVCQLSNFNCRYLEIFVNHVAIYFNVAIIVTLFLFHPVDVINFVHCIIKVHHTCYS